MHTYKAPLRDVRFCMQELLGYSDHYASLPVAARFGSDEVDAVLEAVGEFAEEVLAPLNGSGDAEGARFEAGAVRSPQGFAAAYRRYVDAGWPRLGNPAEYGGEAAPYSLKLAMSEFMQAANHAWCMYGLLNDGGIKTLLSFADASIIERFVPRLVSGEWMSTMCLTEPQCGSDLNLVRCRADAQADDSYVISGTKIFISSGEQDFSENIVHLVLAKLPDAAAGTRGISLFVVPKRKLDASGDAGDPNAIRCISIEHKMGLKASATCVMAFDGAQGWLVGEPGRGLNAMFVYINKSRLGTAQQAQAHAEGAFQASLAYARERLTGRSPLVASSGQAADALIMHPDIRRMLFTQKAIAEGGRALVLYCAKWVDLADGEDAAVRAVAEQRLALITPIAKGALSEWATEATDLGIQILGGHGYIREWGLEQRVRDVRVTRIYEGTTSIQGTDLLGRKLLGSLRPSLDSFALEIRTFCERNGAGKQMAPLTAKLLHGLQLWIDLTEFAAREQQKDAAYVGSVAVDYLLLAGYVSVGYLLAMSAHVAVGNLESGAADAGFYRAKLQTAQFYFDKLLPRIASLEATIRSGSAVLRTMEEADLP